MLLSKFYVKNKIRPRFKAVRLIHEQSLRTKLDSFRIEDIYFTGILRAKANITKMSNFLRTTVDYKVTEHSSAISSHEAPTFYHVEPTSMTVRHFSKIARKKSNPKFEYLLFMEKQERSVHHSSFLSTGKKTHF